MKEMAQLQNPDSDISSMFTVVQVEDNICHWIATISGPADSLYDGYKFDLDIQIPSGYPFEPPGIKFITRIEHVNVNRDGDICLDTIKVGGSWAPSQNIQNVLKTIRCLLEKPNADDPFNSDLAQVLRDDSQAYEQRIRAACEKYASK